MASLVLASILWSLSFGLIKDALAGYDPRLVAAVRLVLAAAAFAPWLRRSRGAVFLAGLGAVQFGLMYVLYIASYATLPAHAVALFTVTTPLYVVLLDDALDRRVRARSLGAAVLAAAGAGWIVWRALPGADALSGVLLLQAANLCFAAGQTAYRRYRGRLGEAGALDAGSLAWMYVGAAVLAAVAAIVSGHADVTAFDRDARLALLYLGLLPTALGFWLWNRGVAATGAALGAVMNNLKVPLGIVAAWLVFGESVDPARLLPGAAALVGALLLARPESAKSD